MGSIYMGLNVRKTGYVACEQHNKDTDQPVHQCLKFNDFVIHSLQCMMAELALSYDVP